jgi:N-acetyl sugar amidotransferase
LSVGTLRGVAQSCKRCLYNTTHPLGLVIGSDGICSGCRVHDEKDILDWDERWRKLVNLVEPYRSKSGKHYDCIVPVSGANDSYYIVHIVKEKLGLNPLLVTYNKYFNTDVGIKNLANLRIKFDCDIVFQNVNPISVKNITRTTLRTLGSIYWPCIAGQTVFPVQTAVRYKIPLIIWGANQGLEQVGMFSHEHEVEMTRRYRKDHDLMGFEADDLLSTFDTLREQDIWQYRYPDDHSLQNVGVRGIYLGNYVRWDPLQQHRAMVTSYGYEGCVFSRTFDQYDYVDCYNYMGVHDLLKSVKQGYSKVTDHACREIRHGRLTRQQATLLVEHFEQQPVLHDDLFLEWLGVSKRGLDFVINQVRRSKGEEATYHEPVSTPKSTLRPIEAVDQDVCSIGYPECSSPLENVRGRYITIGKGWSENNSNRLIQVL